MRVFFHRVMVSLLIFASVLLLLSSLLEVRPVQVNKALITDKYLAKLADKPKYSSIIRLFNKDNLAACSGVVIDANYALTAAHCVENGYGNLSSENFIVKDQDLESTGFTVKAVAFNTYQDVALLKGDFSYFNRAGVDFSGKTIKFMSNQRLLICGYPSGSDLFCTKGVLYGNSRFLLKGQCSLMIKGMSGGPVFDDASGKVIGVNSAVASDCHLFGPVLGIDGLFNPERNCGVSRLGP